MSVCLATVNAKPAFTPLSLLYLKAYLVARGTLVASDVHVVELDPAASPADLARRLLEGAPSIVGLSCYVWNVKKLLAAAALMKEQRPDLRVVLGGPEVGPVARSVLEANPAVDCVVKSEGELPFNDIVRAWRRGDDLSAIAGLCFREGGEVVDTGDATPLADLNELASPQAMIDFDPKGRVICLETQRGCVFRCNFCFYNKDLSIRNRRFDLGRVKEEIRFWLEQDIAQIYLMDPVFNLNAARAKEICAFIAEHNTRRIRIHTEVWAEFIDEEMARLMKEAHFRFLEVGLQTTDDRVLVTVERRLRMARFLEGIDHLKRHDIPFELQLIYGLPGETRASFRTSLNFAASLEPPDLAVFPLMLLPGTELRRKAAGLDIDFDPEPPYFVRSHRSMTPEDIAYGLRVSEAVGVLARSWTVRLLSREPGLTFADIVDAWLGWEGGAPQSPGGTSTEAPQPGVPPVRTEGGSTASPRDAAQDDKGRLGRFILHLCASRGIPPEFYEASARVELRATPPSQ